MLQQFPSLNSLRAFEVVSRHLNYHAAAKELNVTPAAVKQLVSKLEDTIGIKLIERAGKGLKLTARGEASCADLTLGMEKLAASVETMRGQRPRNRLIVTVETSFATAWLVPKLEQFRQRHPEISVLIDSTQNIVDLSREAVDIAIRYGVENHGSLIAHRLFDDLIFPACSPALISKSPVITDLQDLKHVPLIHWDMSHLDWVRETKRWFAWDRWLTHVGVEGIATKGGIIFSDYGLAVQAAVAGQGMLLASWPILREPIESGLLVCPFQEKVATDIGYDLAITQDNQHRPDVKAFSEWVFSTIEDEQRPVNLG
ncbi:MAG: LysR family transcriptional regulator [Acidiferrobacterales bacterium]|nr:LysR family transcriptional regulator [Acidiferrobacterales bacterium]